MRTAEYRGYRIQFPHGGIGYSVYMDDECVAAGGVMFNRSNEANLAAAKDAIDGLIAGTRKPLSEGR